ncbi:allophanate hydrolase [Gordonia sp. L191]|uniref:allophanate hydrolase n=1 Tax=Gordonia sp. L191 TaxID=2982699 RepID=UPI0024C0C688|nr:allophanate hydrolase [Gordonia sp. L191]WHU48215.1 allophanate hydrolase [Gordonia sp. L191]
MTRIDDLYARIAEADRPEVFITLRPHTQVAAEYAESLAAGGPLAGMVLAVKDNVDVAGVPTTAACPGYAYTPDTDAPAVAALRAAGAVVIGKTNLDQFATGLVGTRSPHGAVRDSRRSDRISGGSSSGSAVAVALGFADIAIGTDTAGSGRVPAALQGIVGVKPTLGVVSTTGVVPACADHDVVTIFAADLDTADRAMAAMADACGPRPFGGHVAFAAPETPVLAVPEQLPELDAAWRAAFGEAVARAEDAGFRVKTIDVSAFLAAATLLYDDALVAQRYDAVGEFLSGLADPVAAGVDPTVAAIITGADRFSAVDLLRARRRLADLRERAMHEWGDADALMVPTAPRHPRIDEVTADPIGVNSAMGTYTNFCNLLDLCAVAVPAGTVDEPDCSTAQFGITLLGKAHHDAAIMDLARRFRGDRLPRAAWPESHAGGVELAVFGAHMRGGPLTHELSGRGARWAGEVLTAPNYRLVKLDTVPPKPGLIRDPECGAPIHGERWILSASALGEFLAALPEPMMLGRVELSDGRWVVGFGCAADAGAEGERLDRDRW